MSEVNAEANPFPQLQGQIDSVMPIAHAVQEHEKAELDAKKREEAREIEITDQKLYQVVDRSLTALKYANDPPFLFIRNGVLVRVQENEDHIPVITQVTLAALKGILDRKVVFYEIRGKKIPERKEIDPPRNVLEDILSLPSTDLPFPSITGVTNTPLIDRQGYIRTTPGYDPVTRLYYHPPPGTIIPPVPENPTEDDVIRAIEKIRAPFLDFPLVDDASRAHIVAAVLTAVLRPMIQGSVPMVLIDKPAPGTGASLIGNLIGTITTGSAGAIITAPRDEDTWSKKITSILLRGNNLVIVDNIETKLYSPALAAALTAPVWEDRILGKSEMVTLPCRLTWIANGNNIQLGGDLARRCIWARMDARSSRPWQREVEYQIPDVMGWTRLHRGEILGAALTLARTWIRAGSKDPGESVPKLGGFEDWRLVIGGILTQAGATGFLGNLEDLYCEMDVDGTQWDAFIQQWYEIWGDSPVAVANLINRIKAENDSTSQLYTIDKKLSECLPDDIVDVVQGKGSPTRRMGRALGKRKDRVFTNNLTLVDGGVSHHSVMWRVKISGSNSPAPTTPNSPDLNSPNSPLYKETTISDTLGELRELCTTGNFENISEKEEKNEKNVCGMEPASNSPNSPTLEKIYKSLRPLNITQADIPPGDKWRSVDFDCVCITCQKTSHKDGPEIRDRTGHVKVRRIKTGIPFWIGDGNKKIGPVCDTCRNTLLSGVHP